MTAQISNLDEASHSAATATAPVLQVIQPSGTNELFSDIGGSDRNKLEKAFEFFNDMSRQLTDAYHALEEQVRDLNEELVKTEAQHESELAAKQRVEGRLEGLLFALPVGVVLLDIRGRVAECNPAAIELLGEPLEGERWLDIIARCFSPRLDDGHEVSMKDGRRVSIATRSLDSEPGQLIVLTDMSETRALQERLSHHQRLSALGKMVASLAHQIRTPLSAAIIYGEHLQNPELTVEQQNRFAERLMSRLNHLEHQVRDMLIFARSDIPIADRVTVEDLLLGLQQAIESGVEPENQVCEITSEAHNCLIQCNREALIGAVMNLINNALQAIEKNGRVRVHIEQSVGGQVNISVRDTGAGIDETIRDQVTEAFFTTKSHGTGLGLAVVKAVIRAHQGEMSICSELGEGTCVALSLPLYQANELHSDSLTLELE